GLRHARLGGPRPVVVGVRGLRSCGRAPAHSILHASWIQDVAECRMARSRPRSDMEASTISYLRAALIERGTEAKRGGAAINARAGLNGRQAEETRRGAATDLPEVRRRIRPRCGYGSARGVVMNLRADLNELARSGQGPELA